MGITWYKLGIINKVSSCIKKFLYLNNNIDE